MSMAIRLTDDEPKMLRLCQDILGLGGYEVLPVGSADEALRVLQNGTAVIDLLLSDVVMGLISQTASKTPIRTQKLFR